MNFLKKAHWQILVALIASLVVGICLREFAMDDSGKLSGGAASFTTFCTFLGQLFLNALKMIIVPLIVSSIICGIGGVGKIDGFARLGIKTLAFYALTSSVAILIGLTAVNVMQPGLVDGEPNPNVRNAIENRAAEMRSSGELDEQLAKIDTAQQDGYGPIADIFKRMLPPNIVEAAAQGQMLGLIVFSILFAVAMTKLNGSVSQTMMNFIQGLNDVMITMTHWVMLAAPIGVFGLVTPTIADAGLDLFVSLARYMATVGTALGTHFFIAMPLILLLVGKVNPLRHFRAMRDALITAFSTASSSATLPVTLDCVQQEAGVSKRVSSFTLPLGATVNMDGTALYECVAVIFVAQVLGYDFNFATQFSIVLLALMTSIGVAGVPSASLVAIVVIMQSVKIEGAEAAIAVLFSVDRLLDMSRTAVNVFGDSCAAVVIAKSEGEDVLTN